MGRFFDRISARFATQEQKGIEKYGQPLEQNHGDFDYRLEHLAQELTDGLHYIEWVKEQGQVICAMFEMLVEDAAIKGDFCPLYSLICTPSKETCVACLTDYYGKKAREKIIGI